ncbi:MAG: TIM-barrel domain-containing protein [Coprococcus sp.]
MIDASKDMKEGYSVEKTVKVDVGDKKGYKVQNRVKNKDFVSIMRQYTVDAYGVVFLTDTYLDNEAAVRISFAAENVYRLQMYPFRQMDVRRNQVFDFPEYTAFEVSEDELFVHIRTSRLELMIRKCPWELVVYLDGKPLTREHIKDFDVDQKYKAMPLGFEYDLETGHVINTYDTYYMHTDEAFYGFGEKFTEFNKRGQIVDIWQKDALSTNSDRSYKGMPYFMSSYGYSVLLNTFTRTSFNMGATSGVSYTMLSQDPYMDYYVFCNRNYKGLIQDYTALSGRSDMIPKWAFGFWMSKMSYMSREEVETVVRRAAEFGMSMDVIHIDGWQKMDGDDLLEFDEDRFPNPAEMVENLNKNGVQLSLWMYPYVLKYIGDDRKINPVFAKLSKRGYLLKNAEGETCVFSPAEGEGDVKDMVTAAVDFTNPEAAAYMRDRICRLMEIGIGVIKTDFGEEIPETAVFYDGTTGKESHNKYPLLYARTIYEASKEVKEKQGQRPLLWGRSGYAGSQNYPANWAGDSSTHKNNLAAILRGGLSIGISGVSFWGFDIGGFYNCDYEGNRIKPEDEEYIRSVQMGLLAPLSRSHGQATPREPWEYSSEAQAAFLKMNKFRYRLFPYLYSIACETHRTGVPMMRAMMLEFQDDLNTRNISTQYMLGNALLVAPVFDQQTQHVYLPAGSWIDWNTGERVEGGRWTSEVRPLDELPLYFREDTIIPMLNEAKMHSPEDFFEDYTIYVNLVNGINTKIYNDEEEYIFHAQIDGNRVVIETDMVNAKIIVYATDDISEMSINGEKTV